MLFIHFFVFSLQFREGEEEEKLLNDSAEEYRRKRRERQLQMAAEEAAFQKEREKVAEERKSKGNIDALTLSIDFNSFIASLFFFIFRKTRRKGERAVG